MESPDAASMRAVVPVCLCENIKETTSRNGSDGRVICGCLLVYIPVWFENQL